MVNQCQADLVKRLDKIEQDSHLYTHQAVLTIHSDKQLPLGMRALMYTRKTDGLRAMSLTDVFPCDYNCEANVHVLFTGVVRSDLSARSSSDWCLSETQQTLLIAFCWSLTFFAEADQSLFRRMNPTPFTSSYLRKLTVPTICALDNVIDN